MSAVLSRHDPGARFREDFTANRVDLPGAGLAWLDSRRGAAFEAFGIAGVPHRRVEAWKYTDLATALDPHLEPATRFHGRVAHAGALPDPFPGVVGMRLLLINGFLVRAEQDADDAIEIVDLAKLDENTPEWVKEHLGVFAAGADQPLGAASLALMRGGIAIRIRALASARFHLAFVNPDRGYAQAQHARVLLVLEEGAQLTLLESHTGEKSTVDQLFSNLGMELVLKSGAQLEHIRIQDESSSTLHVASLGGSVAQNARYRGLFVALGARLARLDVNFRLAGPGAEVVLNSVAALARESLADITTVMDHASPDTKSRQLFKSALGARSRSVMQGRVTVREGAVKSDSHQLFKALLLAEHAEADAKPELEIFADDVLCGHGCAIGALDEDPLFYLRARGIPEKEARSLLVRAFLAEAIEGFADNAVSAALWRRLDEFLIAVNGDAS